MKKIIILCLLFNSAHASNWDKRLKPTIDVIDEGIWTAFELNCEQTFREIQTENYQPPASKSTIQPRQSCLQGIFQNSVYFKRDNKDPIAYQTSDGKPYLELLFTNPGKYFEKDAPKDNYSLKLILHNFNGKGKYLVSHQNETFKPRYDEQQPIKKTKMGVPYLNYNKGAHIPVILGHFAALYESPASAYSSGERIYGTYSPGDLHNIIPASTQLGFVEVENIDNKGIINGHYKIRLMNESCSDPLAVKDCRMISSHIKGRFTAALFKPNKEYIKQNLKPRLTTPSAGPKLKPRLAMPSGSTGLKPRLAPASTSQIIIDVPQPRTHKPLMGYNCKASIANACKTADKTFENYLGCMQDNNFKRNDRNDTARKKLRGCHSIYQTYLAQSKSCKTLFANDDSCEY